MQADVQGWSGQRQGCFLINQHERSARRSLFFCWSNPSIKLKLKVLTKEMELQVLNYIDQLNAIRFDVAAHHSAAVNIGELITGAEVRSLLKALKELEQSSAEERIIFEAIDAAVAEGTDTSAASFFESPALLPLALTCSASS